MAAIGDIIGDAYLRLGVDSGPHLDGTLTTARSKLKRWGSNVARELGKTLRGAFSTIGDIAGFGGVASIAFAARQVLDFEKRLVRLRIASRASADDMAKLRDTIRAMAQAKGVGAEDLLGGVEKFVEATGDFEAARASLDGFATIAAATGASMDDIAKAAAALSINMKISGPQMAQALATMAMQGKAGAVELKNFAGILPSLTPQFSQFGTKGMAGLTELGAMAQIMRSGFSSAEETATGLSGLMTALVKNADKLKKEGVQVFKPGSETELRDLADIAFEIGEKIPGLQKQQKLLGRAEAAGALRPLLAAGRGKLNELIGEGGNTGEILKDAATYAASAGGQMARLKEELSAAFSDQVVGNINAIVEGFKALVAAAKFLVENPWAAAAGFGVLKMGIGGVPGWLGRAGGGAGKGAAGAAGLLGGAAATVGGAVKVWVVNMGAGGSGALGGALGGPGVAGAGGAAAAAARRAQNVAQGAQVAAGIGAGVASVWGSLTEGSDVTGGNVATGVLGGLLLGGPVGAAVAGAVAGGGYIGSRVADMTGGAPLADVAGERAGRYGAFGEQSILGKYFDPTKYTLQGARSAAWHTPDVQAEVEQGERVRQVIDQALKPLDDARLAMAIAAALRGLRIQLTGANAIGDVLTGTMESAARRGG